MERRCSFTLLLIIAVLSPASTMPPSGYHMLRLIPTTQYQLSSLETLRDRFTEIEFLSEPSLMSSVDINVPPYLVEYVSMILTESGLQEQMVYPGVPRAVDKSTSSKDIVSRKVEELASKGISHRDMEKFVTGEVETPDWLAIKLSDTDKDPGAEDSIVGKFPRYGDLMAWMLSMEEMYPDLAKTEDIGTTYQGRTMKLIKLGSKSGREKPIIWVDAGLHGDEWLSVGVTVWIIDKMASLYATNFNVTVMMDRYDWYFLPVANPDGYEYTHTAERTWRKTLTPNNGSSCLGTDPNGNWDYKWGGDPSHLDPCHQIYIGPEPFSEPCVRNMRDAILAVSNRTRMYIDIHSSGQKWLTPYFAGPPNPPDSDELLAVANRSVMALNYVNGESYEVGIASDIYPPAMGTALDWVKAVAGVKYSFNPIVGLYRPPGSDEPVTPSEIVPTGLAIWAAIIEAGYLVLP